MPHLGRDGHGALKIPEIEAHLQHSGARITIRVLLLFSLITVLCSSPAASQAEGSLPRVLELPASTRAMALGNAYMMDAVQADVVFYHPALLTGAGGFGIDFQRWGSPSSTVALSAATQWFGIGLGVGILTLQYGAPGAGENAVPAEQDHLFDLGPVPLSERVAVIGAAREVMGFNVGIGAKFVEERIDDLRDAELLIDLSAAREIGPVTVGLTVQDYGAEPIVGTSSPDVTRVVLGLGSYGHELGIFDVGVTAAGSFGSGRNTMSGGLEIGYWPIQGRTFVGRVGLTDVPDGSEASPLTLGFVFWGDELVIEWAFHPVDGSADGGTHRFGARWQ